jgi:hypothetical protein
MTPTTNQRGDTMRLLNVRLYKALERRFHHVLIANEGYGRNVRYHCVPGSDVERADVMVSGEEYRVCCPFCGDARHHLYVNHAWGRYDSRTRSSNKHLFHCFRCECETDPDERTQFQLMVDAALRSVQHFPSPPLLAPPPPAAPMALPANLIPVADLPTDHPAARYLRDRGFDLVELSARWGVSYCPIYWKADPAAANRIIIPIYHPDPAGGDPILAGWQARYVGAPPPGVERYLSATGMKRSRVIYNLPAAVATRGPVVVVEGPADVWRLGAGAVALLGKSATREQRDLFVKHFAGRPIVIALDRDAEAEGRNLCLDLQGAREHVTRDSAWVTRATLPPGRKDLGECTPEEAGAAIAAAVRTPVDWLEEPADASAAAERNVGPAAAAGLTY